MLVLKIKPCMSKYKRFYTLKLRTAHYISYNLLDRILFTWITVVILELIHAKSLDCGDTEGMYLLDTKSMLASRSGCLMIHNN